MTTIASARGSAAAVGDVFTSFRVTVEHQDVIDSLVTISGELDLATAPRLDEALSCLCRPAEDHRTILDCSGVTFCDATGLSVFIRAHQHHQECGGALRLTACPPILQRLLALTGLEHYLDTGATSTGAGVPARARPRS